MNSYWKGYISRETSGRRIINKMSLNIATSARIESPEWFHFNELDVRGEIELCDGGYYDAGEVICFMVPRKDWARIQKGLKEAMPGVTYHKTK